MINCGSLFSFTVLSWVQTATGDFGFFQGYLICAIAFFLAICVFLGGKSRYYCQPPAESLLAKTLRIIWDGIVGCKGLNSVKKSNGGPHEDADVDDVIGLIRVLPILSFFVIYWTLQNQVCL